MGDQKTHQEREENPKNKRQNILEKNDQQRRQPIPEETEEDEEQKELDIQDKDDTKRNDIQLQSQSYTISQNLPLDPSINKKKRSKRNKKNNLRDQSHGEQLLQDTSQDIGNYLFLFFNPLL